MRKLLLLAALVSIACAALAQEYRASNGMPGKDYWQNHPSYVIKADLDASAGLLKAEESVTYTNNSPKPLSEIVFNLYNNYNRPAFEILSVKQRKKPVPEFKTEGTKMIAKLAKPLKPGASTTLNISYTFKLTEDKSIFNRSGKYGSDYFAGYWYPQIAVYDDDGWDMVSHTGMEEFYFELADYDITIITHDNYFIYASVPTASGAMPDYKASASNEWHFVAKNLYDFSFAASNSMDVQNVKVEIPGGEVNLVMLCKSQPFASKCEDAAISFIKKASSNSAPRIKFPFQQVVLFDNGGYNGGMEFPGMVNLGLMYTSKESAAFVVQHELAHEYAPFTAGFNQASQGFMDEGFAMLLPYIASGADDIHQKRNYVSLCFADMEGSTGALSENTHYPIGILTKPSYAYKDFGAYNDMSYNKSFVALYMMREVIGAQKFDNMVHEFFTAWAGKHPKAEDFLNAARAAYGSSLDWFINPWYYQPQRPDIAIAECGENNGKYYVKVKNNGGVPMPVKLIAGHKANENECGFKVEDPQHFYYSPEVWKDGNEYFTIEIDKLEFPFFVTLGCDEIPDQSYNPIIDINSKEDFGPISTKAE